MASKQVWLYRVASAAAGNLAAGWEGEILGMTEEDQDELSEAEQERLVWAVNEVQRRLHAMGTREE